ncbi:bifunctional oligoribonuclease/PAP phosphatase NrnA [Aliibacillus thermotolerans]|uniref:Bifunctional oligoribonuclease/PAP phosphatase NrnA n=1 Tax=Aliibacillus thermotolerans TaxID=1834418 RepID=A0ABW0U7L5_9BACI|nr:bifunctional oligoribonuclease/PAP phosphatase NrnA [Aliibacillus thermotolerans]MDA3129813.1 bifunctional oligoribonuclease/PAP phosphatase NrnA [Aliibacillus thermotolerans]
MKKTIIEAIESYDTIFLYRHEKPDPDALGSQIGLALLITHNYPNKTVIAKGEMDDSFSFLVSEEAYRYRETEVQEDALVIVLDTANTERIDGDGWNSGKQLIKIDHHPEVEDYGDVMWVDTKASSTSEMILALAMEGKESKGWEWTTEAARLLYAGIVGDTGRFQFSNTTPTTLRLAAEALEYPFDTTELFTHFYENSEALIRLKGRVLLDFELTKNGLGIAYLTQQTLKEYGVTANESSAVVNAFANTEGLKAWVFFVEEEDGTYRVRLRSKGPVIHTIAEKHNGGGHPMAAGAKVKDEAEMKEIIRELNEKCAEVV